MYIFFVKLGAKFIYFSQFIPKLISLIIKDHKNKTLDEISFGIKCQEINKLCLELKNG